MNGAKPVNIGGVMVGDGYPTLFLAEIGTFFNRDIELGQMLIRQSVKAGAKVIKSEILHDPDVCLKNTGQLHEYHHAKGKKTEIYRELIERKIVSLDQYEKLFRVCKELGVPYIASVYDFKGIDFFVEIGGSALKIARNNINNVPLIRHAAQTGLPIILDAGVTYFHEVAFAAHLAGKEGAGGVIINHHPGANPASSEIHNMRIMQTYKEALNVPVGLSCHYAGDEILYLAVGMGANLLEKGVVDDPSKIEQDIISAASLEDLPGIISKVENCWKAIGKAPVKFQEPRDLSVRAGMVAKCSIEKGETLDLDNVRFSWPPDGISAEHWDIIEGKKSNRNLNRMDVIKWNDVNFSS